MPIKNPLVMQAAVPQNPMDQVVDILTGSFVANPATGSGFAGTYASTTTSVSRTPVAPDYFYVNGLWSSDGGATWQQMGASIAAGTDSVVGQLTLGVGVNSTGQYDLSPNKIFINATNGGFGTPTILYKIILMARYDQTTVIPIKQLSQVLRYATKNSYMKIAFESSVALPTSGTTVIPHNLGYVPNFVGWILFDDRGAGSNDYYMGQVGSSLSADTTNLYCTAHAFGAGYSSTLYYRIYLNA